MTAALKSPYLRSAAEVARYLRVEESWVRTELLPRLDQLGLCHACRSGWRMDTRALDQAVQEGVAAQDWTPPKPKRRPTTRSRYALDKV